MTVGLAVRVVRGLEWVAADEVATELEASSVVAEMRQVTFTLPEVVAGVGELRCADDAFVRVGVVRGVGRDRAAPLLLARAAATLDVGGALDALRSIRHLPARPAFDVVASVEGDRRFNRYAVEDALGEALSPVLAGTYGSRRSAPPPPGDVSVRVALCGERASVMVRIGARPLHRRPWKLDTAAATLHPPVAAALVRLVGPVERVIDPFCGDGTILIEAGLGGRAPSLLGGDLDRSRLVNAGRNARRAGISVGLCVADATAGPWRSQAGAAWITNPPWGDAARPAGGVVGGLHRAWRQAGRSLGPGGILAVIADGDIDLEASLLAARWRPVVAQSIRLVGRVCRLAVAVGGDGVPGGVLSDSLRAWQRRAGQAGVVAGTAF